MLEPQELAHSGPQRSVKLCAYVCSCWHPQQKLGDGPPLCPGASIVGEISLLALGFRKEELRSCLAVPSHGCHVFPHALHAKHAQTMLCEGPMPGWNTLYMACKTAAYNPRGMSHRRLAPTTWNWLDRKWGVISGLQCALSLDLEGHWTPPLTLRISRMRQKSFTQQAELDALTKNLSNWRSFKLSKIRLDCLFKGGATWC